MSHKMLRSFIVKVSILGYFPIYFLYIYIYIYIYIITLAIDIRYTNYLPICTI